jgi:hypothetical protein
MKPKQKKESLSFIIISQANNHAIELKLKSTLYVNQAFNIWSKPHNYLLSRLLSILITTYLHTFYVIKFDIW